MEQPSLRLWRLTQIHPSYPYDQEDQDRRYEN
jgi:hypothetical protein